MGKGPRPKLHVTWAPDVYDPPCTSSSHTVSQSNRKHHHPKHDKKSHKSKSSNSNHNKLKSGIRGDSRKKFEKKLSRKPRQADEASVLRYESDEFSTISKIKVLQIIFVGRKGTLLLNK